MRCCNSSKWQLCGLLLCGGLGLLMLAQAHAASGINGYHSVEATMEAYKHTALEPLVGVASEIWATIGPGGRWHPAWFLEHKGHLVIEGMLMVLILGMLLQHRFRPKEQEDEEEGLTEKEMAQLIDEWQPEPLVPDVPVIDTRPEPPVITKRINSYTAIVANKQVLNLASADFLGLGDHEGIQAKARATVESYGVGSCGPRGFYGTFDVHLDLEKALAGFMGTQEAIIYSYDISTIASVVPAFASRPDILVVDEGVNFAVQQGVTLSRARTWWFRHNDADHLAQVLATIEAQEQEEGKPLCRKMVVVEGVYANSGDIAPLKRIYELKEKYRYRLCVEESHALGVLGAKGRGACEAAGLAPGDAEVVCASMGTALASVGGFCVGSHEVCDHQRLSGQGYCFSASLPPYLATAAQAALQQLEVPEVQQRAAALRVAAAGLRGALQQIPGLVLPGMPASTASPLVHLQLSERVLSVLAAQAAPAAAAVVEDMGRAGGAAGLGAKAARGGKQVVAAAAAAAAARQAAEGLLQQLADRLIQRHGVLVGVPRYSQLDRAAPPPSLKLYVNAGLLQKGKLAAVAAAVAEAAQHVGLEALVKASGGKGR